MILKDKLRAVANLSLLHKTMLSAAVIVVVFGIILRCWVMPLQQKIKFLQEQIKISSSQINVLESKRKNIADLRTTLQMLTAKYAAKKITSAEDFSFVALLKVVTKLAEFSGVQLIALKPILPPIILSAGAAANSDASAQSTNLSVTGTYEQLITFLRALAVQRIIIDAPSFALAQTNATGDTNILTLQTTFIFYPAVNSDINSSNHQDAKQRKHQSIRDPFMLNNTIAQNSLVSWSTADLHLLGTVEQDGELFGVVSDPLGATYRVERGMEIGLGHNFVKEITEDAIITDNKDADIYRS